ncbi:MAG: hypothetical protein AAGA63_03390 [Pseudomonadota bacterium]
MSRFRSRPLIVASLLIICVFAFAKPTSAQDFPQMRLLSDLDFPGEGYCIDVVGVGPSARTDLPLVMHNCLPRMDRVDRYAVFEEGKVKMPAFDACVTAFGVNGVLPGSPVLLRPCDRQESFLRAGDFQDFEFTQEGQLRLRGTEFCLTAGRETDRTFSSSDRWRTLTMQPCSEAFGELSIWKN